MEAYPTLVNALVGVATIAVFHKSLSGKVMSSRFMLFAAFSLSISVLFDHISTHEYHVHTSGAIVVTGASSGIGRAAAVALTKEGFTVYAGVRKEKDAASIRSEGNDKLVPIILDVVNTEHIQAAVKTIEAAGVPLVALVNNAGVAANLPFEIGAMKNWRQVYDVNVFGVVETTINFLPLLRKHKGRIVNIGSIAGDIGGMPTWAPYTSSKHALEAISDNLRNELGSDFGISVSLIKPGAIKTDIWGKMLQSEGKPDFQKLGKDILATKCTGSEATKKLYEEIVVATHEAVWDVDNNPNLPTTDLTDDVIVHAITSPFPKTRYLVAPDAHVFFFLDKMLPDRVMDVVFHWFYYLEGYKITHAE